MRFLMFSMMVCFQSLYSIGEKGWYTLDERESRGKCREYAPSASDACQKYLQELADVGISASNLACAVNKRACPKSFIAKCISPAIVNYYYSGKYSISTSKIECENYEKTANGRWQVQFEVAP